MANKDESWQASNGSSGDGGRKRSSTFSQMQSKGYLDRVKEKRREVSTVMMKLVIMTISYYKGERLKMLKAFSFWVMSLCRKGLVRKFILPIICASWESCRYGSLDSRTSTHCIIDNFLGNLHIPALGRLMINEDDGHNLLLWNTQDAASKCAIVINIFVHRMARVYKGGMKTGITPLLTLGSL